MYESARSNTAHERTSSVKNGNIACPLNFEPREAYIDDLINGHFYIYAANYYHGLPGEQGNPFEASMAPRVCPIRIP